MLEHMELVAPKSAEWHSRFAIHEQRIRVACAGVEVAHIGSTAIPGIRAKDVVDVLVGAPMERLESVAQNLRAVGYVQEGQRRGHFWLCWPAPAAREAVVHVVEAAGEQWHKRLAFRDYLRQHPAEAQAYEALKCQLAAQTDDWGIHTGQKADFVQRVLALAQA